MSRPVVLSNPFSVYQGKIDVIVFAHSLVGTVRGKSAHGLMIHSHFFNVVAVIDASSSGKNTDEICSGVTKRIPIYDNISEALKQHMAGALVFLNEPHIRWFNELKLAIQHKLDIINSSFTFLNSNTILTKLAKEHNTKIYDLRDVSHLQAYPNIEITNRKTKVVFVTGTDCGLGKRTATYELTQAAIKAGLNATMYATGQTGLMLGERGTVIDALILEFSNGVISQHVTSLCNEGYDLVFVEGQSDIFHPANSAMSLALLHGANPDAVIIVHDEKRKVHKGFEEDAELYKMHPLKRYIDTIEMLSLPCGPAYKTVGIATLGEQNIDNISKLEGLADIPVADVLIKNGAGVLLNAVIKHCKLNISIFA
ncbi:MAG: DUF1611 domain-containing protein [Bacteroidales bacterium]|nr:DUF1611 domain-containing protein [Bacteroidales bacterium]